MCYRDDQLTTGLGGDLATMVDIALPPLLLPLLPSGARDVKVATEEMVAVVVVEETPPTPPVAEAAEVTVNIAMAAVLVVTVLLYFFLTFCESVCTLGLPPPPPPPSLPLVGVAAEAAVETGSFGLLIILQGGMLGALLSCGVRGVGSRLKKSLAIPALAAEDWGEG